MSGISLWDIEQSIITLSEIIESPETTEDEKAAARGELERWTQAEIAKVDRVRAFLRHCAVMSDAAKFEADAMRRRGDQWAERGRRLKEICIAAMQASGQKRLEGQSGVLRIQAAGGKQALTITDERLVPPQYKTYTYTFTHSQLVWLCKHVNIPGEVKGPTIAMDTEAIRKALDTPCKACGGAGYTGHIYSGEESENVPCVDCNGSGRMLVPGAELAPRVQVLRVE